MANHTAASLLVLSASMCLWTIVATQGNDEAALLAIKVAAVHGGYGDVLASWNGSTGGGGYCSWEGVRCRGSRQQPRVVALSLPSRGLTGVLSPAVGNLSSLRFLNFSSNALGGAIPASLDRLRHLHTLDLSNNAFSGKLPANLSSCTSLVVLLLQSNHLRGGLPSELGNKLTRLKTLKLFKNNLTGNIPESLANLSSLRVMSLGFNQLEGTIPSSLGNIIGLKSFELAFNYLSGEPPRSVYNLSSLEALQIQGNKLHGSIPAEIGSSFPNMSILSFSWNRFTGSIPASLTNLTTLQRIELSMNRLRGRVPPALGRLQGLQLLYLFQNDLEADDRKGWEFISSLSNCSQLQDLNIADNSFTGQLPSSIGNLSRTLQILHLDYLDGISGSIPSAIGNLVSLEVLGFGFTSVSGVIPDSMGKLGNLARLGLYDTQVSGLIPTSIGNLSRLIELYAQNANLEGAIPTSLGKLKNLISLDLANNRLNSSIPTEIFKLPLLSKYLDLSSNSLSGPLPSEVGSLVNLNHIYLSGNQLSGELPDSIGECIVLQELSLANNSLEGQIPQSLKNIKDLVALGLSMNNLSGTIPESIGTIRNLQILDLSHNNLSGPIPISLQNLTSLSELDLSFNNLQGEVPKEGIFRLVHNFSVTGNNGLCGGIPQLHLLPCHKNSLKKNKKRRMKSLTIALATTAAFLFLAFMVVVFRLIYNKHRQRVKSSVQPPIIEEQYQKVSYHALENGTNGFSETNLLGKGSFGTVYKCTFQDEGTLAAVKVFNLEQSGSSRSFVAECEALRRVRHRCLIKIITCCSSINHQGQEFKALVFEFMPNGSLSDWLHPKSSMPTVTNTLSIVQRLNIAVDIMDGLDYLHNHCQPPIIHCDLKPSNILLAEDMSARVGDFGVSRILLETASNTLQNSNSTIGIRGSIGYVAPGD
jgi:Leucine-rich repeat (LRR) protein